MPGFEAPVGRILVSRAAMDSLTWRCMARWPDLDPIGAWREVACLFAISEGPVLDRLPSPANDSGAAASSSGAIAVADHESASCPKSRICCLKGAMSWRAMPVGAASGPAPDGISTTTQTSRAAGPPMPAGACCSASLPPLGLVARSARGCGMDQGDAAAAAGLLVNA